MAQLPPIKRPLKQETLAQVQFKQALSILIPLASNNSDYKESTKLLKQINIFNAFSVRVMDIAKLLKQDVFKVVIFKKFIFFNNVIISKEILSAL